LSLFVGSDEEKVKKHIFKVKSKSPCPLVSLGRHISSSPSYFLEEKLLAPDFVESASSTSYHQHPCQLACVDIFFVYPTGSSAVALFTRRFKATQLKRRSASTRLTLLVLASTAVACRSPSF
jgi:hypothetical protein